MCQAVAKEMWMDARREDVLEAPYFHVVFTVPEELNSVILSNQKLLYDTLYHASAATIDELASDSKYLGAKVGYISILHTWGSEMNFHPHIHMILLGGGLTAKNEWKEFTLSGVEFIRRFLMHVSPQRFVRIRHYGLLCLRTKNKKLILCRNLLGCKKYLSRLRDKEMPEKLEILYGIKICICNSCGGHMTTPKVMIPL